MTIGKQTNRRKEEPESSAVDLAAMSGACCGPCSASSFFWGMGEVWAFFSSVFTIENTPEKTTAS